MFMFPDITVSGNQSIILIQVKTHKTHEQMTQQTEQRQREIYREKKGTWKNTNW